MMSYLYIKIAQTKRVCFDCIFIIMPLDHLYEPYIHVTRLIFTLWHQKHNQIANSRWLERRGEGLELTGIIEKLTNLTSSKIFLFF